MPNNLSGIVTTRVDLVKRAALRDPRDRTRPASFLLYKAEGVDVSHTHVKAGGGSFTHEHPITAAASHGHGEDSAGNTSGAQLLPLQNEALRKADVPAEDYAGPDQTFPISIPKDVADAAGLAGHAADPDSVRKKIIAIARRKGAAFMAKLPDSWNVSKSDPDLTDLAEPVPATPTTATDPQGEPAMPNATETEQQNGAPAPTAGTEQPNAGAAAAAPAAGAPVAINKSELAPEDREYLERLEKSQADSTTAVTAARAQADEAIQLAKSERDARLDALYKSEAETFTHLPVPTELHKAEDGSEPDRNVVLAGALRQLDELAPEAAKVIRPMLVTSNEALAKSAVFGEKGSAASGSIGGSTASSVAGKVHDLKKSDPTLTDQQAAAKVYEDNPELFAQVREAETAKR